MFTINDYLLKTWLITLFMFWCFIDISLFVNLFWFTPNDGWSTVIYKLLSGLFLPKMIYSNIVGFGGIATNHFRIVCEFWFISLLYSINLLFCSFYFVDEQDYRLYLWSGLMRLCFTCSLFFQALHIQPGRNQTQHAEPEANPSLNLGEALRVFNEQLIANVHQAQRQANLDLPPPYSEILSSINQNSQV